MNQSFFTGELSNRRIVTVKYHFPSILVSFRCQDMKIENMERNLIDRSLQLFENCSKSRIHRQKINMDSNHFKG